MWIDLRVFVRLIAHARSLEYRLAPPVSQPLNTTAQRVVQHIGGRDYRIEVTQLTAERWRAHVLNVWGGPTALMPFYDATAAQAVGRLTEWLARAHRSVSSATTT